MLELQEELGAALADRYAIERELGRGGMAIVYLARDLKHNRRVAIKVLRPELSSSIGAERFLREITIAARLTHPNILSLHDSGDADGVLYFVMPYVEGESLRHRLDRERQLPVDEAVEIARQVAAALDYAHAQGVVHRDIKPENILLIGRHALVADFGLARAVYSAANQRLTESGIAVGTPAYISPEQASAERSVDGRTDVYSLGCVVFEMIAGIPPYRGATAQAIIAHHVSSNPPSLCHERASCPRDIDGAVRRAMAKVPADRYRTAGEFVRALEGAEGTGTSRSSSDVDIARPLWRRPAAVVSTMVAAVVIAAVLIVRLAGGASTTLDASRVVTLPFATLSNTSTPPPTLTEDVTQRLSDALAQWSDLHVVDERTTRDALPDRGAAGLRTDGALKLARRLGAGRLVWGDVVSTTDSVTVRARLYDVARGGMLKEARVSYPAHSTVLVQPFRVLANRLLRDRDELPWTKPDQTWPASLAAWTAYDSARHALETWDLTTAEPRLREALRIDPEFPQAALWLAQVLSWPTRSRLPEEKRRAQEEIRALTLHALNQSDRLTDRDRAVAAGLGLLAQRQYRQACDQFHHVLSQEPNDFSGWYGLGDCLSLDDAVVVDGSSPSGYAFRSGWHSGVTAYEHAIDVVKGQPPAFPYRRIGVLLQTDPTALRTGRLDSSKTIFWSPPLLVHDTLGFIPYPSQSAAAFKRQSDVNHAVQANMDRLGRTLRGWVRLSPREPLAHEMLGGLLERAAIITKSAEDSVSAIDQIDIARTLTTDSLRKLDLGSTLVRLAVKADSFALATRIADSLLRRVSRPTTKQAESLAGLAALLGERRLTAELFMPLMSFPRYGATLPSSRTVPVPAAVLQTLADAYSRAVLGVCDDTLRQFSRQLAQSLASYVADSAERVTAQAAASWRVLSAAVPCLGADAVIGLDSHDALVREQQAFARSGAHGLRQQFDSVQLARKGLRPGDVAVDYTFQESWLLLAAGDSARAIEHLDGTLNALPTLSVYVLEFPSQAAALVRAMALRADLAARRRDRQTARRWAQAVTILWQHHDPELDSVYQRMRTLALGN